MKKVLIIGAGRYGGDYPFVWLGSFVLQPINKMFATYYYDSEMSRMEFGGEFKACSGIV